MATFKTITAPEHLTKSLESFLDEVQKQDITDYSNLRSAIITFSEVINSGFHSNPEFLAPDLEEKRNEYFEKYVDWSNQVLVETLKSKGITSLNFATPTGIQGAGKGTFNDTLQELASEFVEEIKEPKHRKFSGIGNSRNAVREKLISKANTIEVKVGTGGIFFHSDNPSPEEREYFELFNSMKNAMGAAGGGLVENNIVCIAINLYLSLKVLQHPQGVSSFNVDIYPRSEGQVSLLRKTASMLTEAGIAFDHKTVDFKLLSENEVEYLKANKEAALAVIPEIQKIFAEYFNKAKSVQDRYSFEDLNKDLNVIFSIAAENKDQRIVNVISLMKKECIEAADRAQKRARGDDKPIPLFKRLNDYFKNSFTVPFMFENPLIVPTNGRPQDVAKQFFCQYFRIDKNDKQLVKGGIYFELLRRYQSLAGRKVHGKFDYDLKTNRLERRKSNYTEIVYWNKEKTEIFYTIITKDNQSITYRITSNGSTFWENPLEIEEKAQLSKELGIFIYKTDTIESFWENNPALWGFENLVHII